MRIKALLLACTLFSVSANAQPWLTRLADIAPGSGSSIPNYYYNYNGKLLFSAATAPLTNPVLMQTDGTTAGTTVVSPDAQVPSNYVTLNGKVYFLTDHGGLLNDLWVTDGTTAGTVKINTGISIFNELAIYNNKLIFGGIDANNKVGLWISDGTVSGTQMIKDVGGNTYTMIDRFGFVNGKAVFVVSENTYGENRLWVTDGTQSGTSMIADINVSHYKESFDSYDAKHYSGRCFIQHHGKLYFAANDDIHGYELWETGGSSATTKMVKDIVPGGQHSLPRNFTVYDGKLIFATLSPSTGYSAISEDLWIMEGEDDEMTKLNTSPLTIWHRGLITDFCVYNNYLYFGSGIALYKTDGTPAGTHIAIDSLNPMLLTPYNNYLYVAGAEMVPTSGGAHMYRIDEHDNFVKITPALNMVNNWRLYSIGKLGQSLYLCAATSFDNDLELWQLNDFPNNVADVNNPAQSLLYPNPATNTFSIKAGNNTNSIIKIYSLTGQLMFETKETQNINIEHLPSGIYMVQVTSNGKTYNEKLIKQ